MVQNLFLAMAADGWFRSLLATFAAARDMILALSVFAGAYLLMKASRKVADKYGIGLVPLLLIILFLIFAVRGRGQTIPPAPAQAGKEPPAPAAGAKAGGESEGVARIDPSPRGNLRRRAARHAGGEPTGPKPETAADPAQAQPPTAYHAGGTAPAGGRDHAAKTATPAESTPAKAGAGSKAAGKASTPPRKRRRHRYYPTEPAMPDGYGPADAIPELSPEAWYVLSYQPNWVKRLRGEKTGPGLPRGTIPGLVHGFILPPMAGGPVVTSDFLGKGKVPGRVAPNEAARPPDGTPAQGTARRRRRH